MRRARAWFWRLAGLFGKQRRDRELAAEIECHLQLHIDDNIRSGMTPEEARRDARMKFGSIESVKESYRDRRGIPALETLIQDVRSGLRALRQRPLFTSVAVLTLGIGIGAATAMFSVVDGILLKPLPYDDPSRLVAIWQRVPGLREIPGDSGARWDRYRLAYPQFLDLVEKSDLYEGLASYRAGAPDVVTLTGVGEPVELPAGAATSSLLSLLGVRPELGRWFAPGEVASRVGDDGASVAVISYELWQGRLGASPEILGRSVTIDDRRFTIIGILPRGFRINWLSAAVAAEADPEKRDIWFPIGAPGWTAAEQGYSWETIGRLAPEVAFDHAQAEAETILTAHPSVLVEARVLPRTSEEKRGLGAPLVLLFGATGFLLLIACSNVASLTMAEVLSRRHEIATRCALGAGATRIVRLLLAESLVLAAFAGTLGAALAFAGTEFLVALAPPIPRLHEVAVDLRALGFAAMAGTCAAFVSGMVPAVLASRGAVGPEVRGSGGTYTSRRRFTGTVIAIEVAITIVLLVGAGLLLRSYSQLLAVDPGFDTEGLASVEVRLPRSRYPGDEHSRRVLFFRGALDQLEAIPGIGAVAGVSRLPFPGNTSAMNLWVDGRDTPFSPLFYQVSPRYLETLGVSLLAGRWLTEADGPGAPLAVLVNETAARRFWPQESPVGARISLSFPDGQATVVGVVRDMKRQVLYKNTEPTFFIPFSQLPDETICFVARTQSQPLDAIPLMREAIAAVDGDLVVKNATTIAALVAASASHERYRALLTAFFGIMAALLAAAGVFGVTAHSVALRTREMGVRMALGARSHRLAANTAGEVLLAAMAGLVVGLMGAWWASRLIGRFLFGVEPSDPATYLAVAASIGMVCLFASYLAARRISKLNPMEVLRPG